MVRKYLSAWWLLLTPLENDGVSNSWDDDMPNMMEKWKMFQTTNQYKGIRWNKPHLMASIKGNVFF